MKKNLFYSFSNILINTLYPLAVFPYISRVLSVSSIGTYNYYSILFAYIVLFASFGVSLYASKEIGRYQKDIQRKNKLVNELLIISIFNSFLAIIFIGFPVIYFAPSSDKLLALIFSLMIIANSISVEWYYVATENQKFIFYRNLFFKSISLFLIFYLIKGDNDLIVYALVVVLSLLLNAIVNFIKLLSEIKKSFKLYLNLIHYRGLIVIFLVEITFRYYGMGDVAILEKFVTREELGFLTFSLSIFNIISSFLKIIATTLLPRVSFMIHTNNLHDFYILIKKTFSLIFFISFPSILLLFFSSDTLAILFGGMKFASSSNLIKAFCPLILISSIINTFVFQILYPLGRTRSIVVSYIFSILINIVLNLFLIPKISSYSLIFSSILSNILVILMLLFLEKEKLVLNKLFSKDIIKYSMAFITSFVLMHVLSKLKIDAYNISAMFSGLILYLFITIILKDTILYKTLTNILRRR